MASLPGDQPVDHIDAAPRVNVQPREAAAGNHFVPVPRRFKRANDGGASRHDAPPLALRRVDRLRGCRRNGEWLWVQRVFFDDLGFDFEAGNARVQRDAGDLYAARPQVVDNALGERVGG